jgi:membrane peptidoglycan carboxypeptidase
VTEALRHSTNLVFVRLMRDVAKYYMFQSPGSSASLLADADDPRRADYLARFADKEGKEFLAPLLRQVQGQAGERAGQDPAGKYPQHAGAAGGNPPHRVSAGVDRAVQHLPA